MRSKKTRRAVLAVCAVLAVIFVWTSTSLGARLCFTARLLAALPDADKEAEDTLTNDGSRLMFQDQQTLALLTEFALTGQYEDVTGYNLSTWESPSYWIGDWEVGGSRMLFHTHFGRFYLVTTEDANMMYRFEKILKQAGV